MSSSLDGDRGRRGRLLGALRTHGRDPAPRGQIDRGSVAVWGNAGFLSPRSSGSLPEAACPFFPRARSWGPDGEAEASDVLGCRQEGGESLRPRLRGAAPRFSAAAAYMEQVFCATQSRALKFPATDSRAHRTHPAGDLTVRAVWAEKKGTGVSLKCSEHTGAAAQQPLASPSRRPSAQAGTAQGRVGGGARVSRARRSLRRLWQVDR